MSEPAPLSTTLDKKFVVVKCKCGKEHFLRIDTLIEALLKLKEA